MKRTYATSTLVLGILVLIGMNASAQIFKPIQYYRAGERPYKVMTAQLTRSGNLDLVVGDYLTDQMVVFLGNGDGTFQKGRKFPVSSPIDFAIADLNNDGNQDLVIAQSGGTGNGTVAVFLGNGGGMFKHKASYQVGSEAGFVTIADFDDDGKLDVAETDGGKNDKDCVLRIFRGTGKGTLLKATTYRVSYLLGALAASDLNGDGWPDLAIVTAFDESVAVFMNDGTGKFKKPVNYEVNGNPQDIKIADLRNDGNQDLVVGDEGNGLDIWLNNGDGTFGNVATYKPGFSDWQGTRACTIADFNVDGKLDVACAGFNFSSYWFRGKGDGTFEPAVRIRDTGNYQDIFGIASGDFDNNGAPDLAIPVQIQGKVAVLLNTK